jgi:hypothetical protein
MPYSNSCGFLVGEPRKSASRHRRDGINAVLLDEFMDLVSILTGQIKLLDNVTRNLVLLPGEKVGFTELLSYVKQILGIL